MDAPSFVVIPATPVDSDILATRPPLSPLSSSSTANTPDLSVDDPDRSSSETTIVTIYSMYEDDEGGSWSAPQPVLGRRPASKDGAVDVALVDVSERGWSARPIEDSAYFESADWRRSKVQPAVISNGIQSRPPSVNARTSQTSQPDSRRSSTPRAISNGSLPALADRTSTSTRPPSSHARTSQTSQSGYSTPRAMSNGSLSALADGQPSLSHPRGLPSSPSPQGGRSSLANGEASREASTSTPPSRGTTPPSAQVLSIPASSPPPRAATPPQLRQGLLTPQASPPRLSSVTSSPSSMHSVTRLPDEDPDGFHVRSTYAQLDMCGVRGDGIEEGVERTRARVGGSRMSELRAEEALADAREKTRELTPQEVKMLASLDRYGFYVTPSHDRIILLPTAPLLKPLTHTTAAATSAPASAPPLSSIPVLSPPPKERRRVGKWGRMLQARARDEGQNVESWGIKPSKEAKLRERTFKGVPDCWRRAAWDTLLCRMSRHGTAETRALMQRYREVLDSPSTYDVQIDLDVPRTISGHVMFRTRYGQGQRSLFHVLHCLSLYCDTCGYCQGMGPIAATLLCYFEPERAYASLVRLHDAYQMHTIFSPGFPGLLEAIYVQERIMEQMLPVVYTAFKKHMISTTSYATKWYITLFANSVPFQTQLRLWDAFLLEGHDIFVVVAVAIVWVYRDHITSAQASFETVLSLLSSFFVPEDENALLGWVEKVIADKKLRTSMQQWRKDWQRLVAAGQHNQALL